MDNEKDGLGNSYDYGARLYNPRLGRFLSVDKLGRLVPGWTPYRAFFDDPLNWTDPTGNIEFAIKGNTAVNKKDAAGGGFGLKNTVVRTSTYKEIRTIGTSPHIGIDYRAKIGTNVYSLGDGKVSGLGTFSDGKTQYIEVEYSNGDKVRFLHLSEFSEGLSTGDKVMEGQVIGKTGDSGAAGRPHLHIDAKDKDGTPINPEATNYGTATNEEFFETYGGDYTKLAAAKKDGGVSTTASATTDFANSSPGWSKSSKFGANVYFFLTGKDSGFSDQKNKEIMNGPELYDD